MFEPLPTPEMLPSHDRGHSLGHVTFLNGFITFCKKRPSNKVAFPLIIVSFCVIEFIRSVDTSILPFLIRAVAKDLNANTVDAYWCGAAYLFSMTATQPIFGGLAEVLGRRTCTLATTIIFIVGSITCATAQNVDWLICARVIQGLGSGGMDMAFNFVIVDIVPITKRPTYIGYLQLSAGMGLIFGGLIGALVIEDLSWRVIFWINLPITAGPLLCFIFVLHVEHAPKPLLQQLRSVDWSGNFLITSSIATILFAIFGGGVVYPWSSAKILGPLVAGVCGVALFLLNERAISNHKHVRALIPLRLFGNRTAGVGYFIAFIHGMSLTVFSNVYPLYFYIVDELSFIATAVRMLPTPLAILCSVLVSGYVLSKIKRFKWPNVVGLVLLAAGFVFLYTLKFSSGLGQEIANQIVYGAGVGIIFPGRMMAVQSAQTIEDDVALAASLVGVALNLGQCFGLALGIALFDNFWNAIVRKTIPQGLTSLHKVIYANTIEESLSLIKKLPVELRSRYKHAGSEASSNTFLIFAIICGTTLILSLLSRDLSFDKDTKIKLLNQESGVLTDTEVAAQAEGTGDMGKIEDECIKKPDEQACDIVAISAA